MKALSLTLLLSIVLSVSSCKKDDDNNDSGGGGTAAFTPIPTKFLGEWIRDDLTPSSQCETNYDVDGSGSSSASESQTAILNVTASTDTNGLQYGWYMFTGSGSCDFSQAQFTDMITHSDISIISETTDTIILKAKIATSIRRISFSGVLTLLNAYNSNNGACGKSNWALHDTNSSDFLSGCGVVGGEDGMDDFKFAGASFAVNQYLYWKLVNVDSTHMTFAASTDNGATYGSASSLFLKTP
ncbi:MAG: hypothetical protein HON90_05130 [Halobacteriovoraceae bacterium]|jgi:hypothetical protein|nr:hypothetical protein [Halobacteriovoraceae bacterium]